MLEVLTSTLHLRLAIFCCPAVLVLHTLHMLHSATHCAAFALDVCGAMVFAKVSLFVFFWNNVAA
jgi:hypothetical protein